MPLKIHFPTHNTLSHNIEITACTWIINSIPLSFGAGFSPVFHFVYVCYKFQQINILYLYWRIYLLYSIEKIKKMKPKKLPQTLQVEK